jgi:hypothetical protein
MLCERISVLNPLKPSGCVCTICYNAQKLCILPTECIYVFHIVLSIISDYFPKRHYSLCLCSRDIMCFLWGMNWIFISYWHVGHCPSSCFLFKKRRFGDWTPSPSPSPKIGISSIDWAQLSRFLPEDGDIVQSPEHRFLNKKQDDVWCPKSQ